jgi:aminotransferase
MKDFVSKKVKELAPSGIREFFDLVLETKGVVSLGVGEPDFVSPWKVREKAIYSLEQGWTSYTSNKGLYRLRLEIAHFLKKHYNLVYNAKKEILITSGVSQGLDLTIRTLVNPKDRVLVVYPCYVAYPAVVHLEGAEIIPYYTRQSEKFKVDPLKLERIVKKYKPKVLLLNYPCNPTGVSYTKQELQQIFKVAKKENLVVVSDEIYDLITYDYKHTPFASLKGAKKQTVYLGGFSKNYAMTGFRIGFVCGDSFLIDQMTKVNSYVSICPAIMSQTAAIDALHSLRQVSDMVKEYKLRRNYIVAEFSKLGLKTFYPQGAFYCFVSVQNTGLDCLEFAKRLLSEVRLAVVPGTAFGPEYKDYIRISYASPLEDLKQAVARLTKFMKKIQHGKE